MNRNQAILETAQEAGSRSKTVKGCTRYILRSTDWKRRGFVRKILHLTLDVPSPWVSPDRTERLEHPCAMRAKSDKVFRRNFLRRIHARVKRLYQLPSADSMLESVAKFQAGRHERSAEMDILQYDYNTVTGNWLTIPKRNHAILRWNKSDLPIYDRYEFKHRGADAPNCISTYSSAPYWRKEDGETTWRNGRAVSYKRVSYIWSLDAFGAIDGNMLRWKFGYTLGAKVAPEGWYWDVDGLGIRLVSQDDSDIDLHVSMVHMLEFTPDEIADQATQNAVIRWQDDQRREEQEFDYAERQKQKAQVQELIDSGELYVCLEDSYSAGNCKTGTLAWVERYFKRTLSMGRKAVPAKMVAHIKDQHYLIGKAIRAAYDRHMRSLEQGFSELY